MKPKENGLIIGDDGRARPPWAAADELLRNYYDTEWGMPVTDERGMFERVCLEGFQVGLSWRLILQKRDALREAFCGFDPDAVACMDSIEHLLSDASLIRNRRKLEAVITNARATVALRERGTDLAEFVWSYQPETTPAPTTMDEVPTRSPESERLAKDLKALGFSFVGPVTMYALMESTGVVDTHLVGSWRRGSSGIWG
ncbi:DNA-3-methyladenine glycosylase I [Corynebacterium sanguinis]|uniref:DNA-3-methyladenine glycosylase I n=1 Tax=Corynebacterium sanguinis TaxID=2594913 RepID=A0A6C1TV68_9CORY|nr:MULTISPECIES: DNA-3-methyladenine glycosylase I [Corynebacterium]MCT1555683.1 DNA-3-methyladenine glycosylase I [Corynebacterium sanguinis]MCT1584562.1 DNA-3-methyladenine glycosylase I [Corynebacterium sanguinis]MCT1613649.1 DNA-3-methyladenine glycosylase I [Corynebacterium sanguinis]MCT1663369.1 DNA-3-methyladenine glycosylase I [Corynebacterium sanguinis]MCT1882539.1 DNA-3-methyladenine glycosylase I [Corynebacterium sanguinis]